MFCFIRLICKVSFPMCVTCDVTKVNVTICNASFDDRIRYLYGCSLLTLLLR